MGNEMSRDTELTTESSLSRVRTRSPEPFERNVRQKTTPPAISAERAKRDAAVAQAAAGAVAQENDYSKIKREETAAPRLEDVLGDHAWRMDEDGDTALTHVVFDQPEHPMYERHVKRILRDMCSTPFGAPLTSLPTPTLQRFSYKEAQAGEQKVREAKELVTKRWLEKILLHVGEALVATGQNDLLVDTDMGCCRLQLKVIPIIQVEDTQPAANVERRASQDVEAGPGRREESRCNNQIHRRNHADLEVSGTGLGMEDEPGADDSDDILPDLLGTNTRDAEPRDACRTQFCHSDLPGLIVERYGELSYPKCRLLLKEAVTETGGERYRAKVISPAIRTKLAHMGMHKEAYRSLHKYCPGHWTVRFRSESEAQSLLSKTINVLGTHCRLESFQSKRSQVYVCSNVPRSLRPQETLRILGDIAPNLSKDDPHRLYVMKSRPSTTGVQAAFIYVILDQPSDVAQFSYEGKATLHFGAWLGGQKCQFCKEEHSLLICDKFAPLMPTKDSSHSPGLLTKRPKVKVAL